MQSLVCTFYFTLCIKSASEPCLLYDEWRHRGWEYLEQRPSLLSCDLTGAEVLSCLLGLTGTLATPPFTSTDRLKKKKKGPTSFFYWDWQAQRPRPHLLTLAGKRLVAIYMWPLCPSVPVKGHVADRYRSHAFFLCRTGRHSWGWREKEKWFWRRWLWWSEQKEKSKTFLLVLNSSWHEADYFF